MISPTLIDTPLKSVFNSGDLNIINSVFESLIFSLFLIIHTLMSEMQFCQRCQRFFTIKRDIELCVVRINMIANIVFL